MTRITGKKVRQAILDLDETFDPFETPERLALFDENGAVIDFGGGRGVGRYLGGIGAPASGLGLANDLYEDFANGDLWQKQMVFGLPSFRSATSTFDSSQSAHAVPMPPDSVVGDLLVLTITAYKPGTSISFTPPEGWTSRGGLYNGGSFSAQVFTKVKEASDGITIPVASSDWTSRSVMGITAYQNSNGVDVAANSSAASATSLVFPSVTTTGGLETVFTVGVLSGDPGGVTPDPTWVERVERVTDSIGGTLYVMDKSQLTAGASGTSTINWPTSSLTGFGWTIALKSGGVAVPTWVLVNRRISGGGVWRTTPTVPSLDEGREGDWHHDSSTGYVYRKRIIPAIPVVKGYSRNEWNGFSANVTYPGASSSGDLIVVAFDTYNSQVTVPTGWTRAGIENLGAGDYWQILWAFRGSETTKLFDMSTNVGGVWQCWAFRPDTVHATDPIPVFDSAGPVTGTSIPAPIILMPMNGLVLRSWRVDGNKTGGGYTLPSEDIQSGVYFWSAGNYSNIAAYKQESAGAVPAKNLVLSASASGSGASIGVQGDILSAPLGWLQVGKFVTGVSAGSFAWEDV